MNAEEKECLKKNGIVELIDDYVGSVEINGYIKVYTSQDFSPERIVEVLKEEEFDDEEIYDLVQKIDNHHYKAKYEYIDEYNTTIHLELVSISRGKIKIEINL